MAGLHDFTTKEVLNKVLLDSSGNAVAAYSHTTQEALNAVLDSANSRLNVKIEGGTISGDVTIGGDLTVEGGGSMTFSEAITGDMKITGNETAGSALYVYSNQNYTGTGNAAFVSLELDHASSSGTVLDIRQDGSGDLLNLRNASTNLMTVTSAGHIKMPANAELQEAAQGTSGNRIKLKNNSNGDMEFDLENPAYSFYFSKVFGGTGALTATGTDSNFVIDINKSGATGSSTTVSSTGLQIDMDDSATNNASSTVNYTGLDIDVNFANTAGISTATGIDINLDNAGTNAAEIAASHTAIKVQVPAGYHSYNIMQFSDDADTGMSYNTADSISISAGANETRFSGSYVQFNGNGGSTSARIMHRTSSATHPVYGFNGGNNYGMGSSGVDVLHLITNSLSRMTIDSDGKVEIQSGDGTTGAVLTLSTRETGVVDNDVLGRINFQAPLEASGTDAILTGASIHAEAQANFSSSVNSTALVFSTGASEEATEKMRLSSSANGILQIKGNFPAINLLSGGEQQLNFSDAGNAAESGIKNNSGTMKFYGSNSAANFRMILDDNSRISLSNNDGNSSNTVFGKDAFTNNGTVAGNVDADFNVAIGEDVMKAGTLGNATYNVGVGHSALTDLTTGDYNVAIGASAASNIVGGSDNVAIGTNALLDSTANKYIVAIGTQALENITDWGNDGSVAIGHLALSNKVGSGSQFEHATTAIGYKALTALTTGTGNTAIGYQSMDAATTSGNNTAIGHSSLGAAVDGCQSNVAIGVQASQNLTLGTNSGAGTNSVNGNVAVGYNAFGSAGLGSHSDSTDRAILGNIAIGKNALDATAGNAQTGTIAIGHESLTALTSSQGNTALGYQAGKALTGEFNTIIGYNAALTASNTNNSTIIGYGAMDAAVSGMHNNTIIGTNAGSAIADGDADNNVIIGNNAGFGGAGALKNSVAVGTEALDATAGNDVEGAVAIGYQALTALTSGAGNIAIGYKAGLRHTTGGGCVYIGHNAADHCTDGDRNVAIGEASLSSGAGDDNVAVGYGALGVCTGADNVGIGVSAGNVIQAGNTNTMIGYDADASAHGAVGQIAIGASVTCTGDNTITVGIGANTASLGLDGSDESWAAASSDERLKENIESSSAGLNVINDLRPVTYNWKKAKDVQKDLPQYKESDEPVLGTEYGEQLHGFIAQEVKEVIDNHDELKDGFKMWKLKDDGTQTVASGNLIPILVKAVQELSARVKELESK